MHCWLTMHRWLILALSLTMTTGCLEPEESERVAQPGTHLPTEFRTDAYLPWREDFTAALDTYAAWSPKVTEPSQDVAALSKEFESTVFALTQAAKEAAAELEAPDPSVAGVVEEMKSVSHLAASDFSNIRSTLRQGNLSAVSLTVNATAKNIVDYESRLRAMDSP